MKKLLSFICVAMISTLVLCSCKSKEERVIDQLDNLAEKIEKNASDWDSEQWEDAFEEIQKIQKEISECKFSNEQLQTLGEVEGRLATAVLTYGAKAVGNEFGSFLQGAGSFVEGFKDGASDAMEENLQEIGNSVKGALNNLMDEWDDDDD